MTQRDINSMYQRALNSLNVGAFGDAEKLFKSVLKSQPDHVGALNLLAITLMNMEQFSEAEKFIQAALTISQSSEVSFYNYGIIRKKLGKSSLAIESFTRALALNPNVAETWNNRGTSFNDIKQYQNAISDFDKAISLNPSYSEAYCNKAKSLIELKRYGDALSSCAKAVVIKPDLAEAWLGSGNALAQLKRHDEALAACDKAVAIKPDLAEAWLGRGNALAQLKRYDQALTACDKAVAIKPDLAEAWLGRGDLLVIQLRYGEAFEAYDKALAIKPDLVEALLGRGRSKCHRGLIKEGTEDYQRALALGGDRDMISFELATFGAANTPIAMPKGMVTRLFDEQAERFDEHLVQKLKYQTPIKILNLISSYNPSKPLDVLDLGCGTGLMGEQLRPIAKKLCGVDISSNMLAKAERRAIYDELICKDIVEFLTSHSETYDLVVAADVFVYFGDLARVFELVARVFRHPGYFCFSVEATNESEYVLGTTGRYQHSLGYLRRLAKNYGFVVEAIHSSFLRKESEKDVAGYVAMMRYS